MLLYYGRNRPLSAIRGGFGLDLTSCQILAGYDANTKKNELSAKRSTPPPVTAPDYRNDVHRLIPESSRLAINSKSAS